MDSMIHHLCWIRFLQWRNMSHQSEIQVVVVVLQGRLVRDRKV